MPKTRGTMAGGGFTIAAIRLDSPPLTERQRIQLDAAAAAAVDEDVRVWLVGGPVRDLLLGRAVGDLDLTVEGDATRVAARLAERLGGTVREHAPFATATVSFPDATVDVATARSEHYPLPGALPLVSPETLREDLLRRDFSINAMAVDLATGALEDPAGGAADLEARRVRVLHDRSFLDDPTRIYRALRLAVRLGFSLETRTAMLMREAIRTGALTT
ncbi:MAG: hypothetical protein ACRD2J_14630, partial [Thermoanaerobaculia bacterium]